MLADIIQGQPKAVKLLSRALENRRLAHAYLFTGPDGVGKVNAARAMAAVLFCREETDRAPCHTCAGCLKFVGSNHPDFLHIAPQGATIKIDQVRELKKALTFPSLEAENRITLIEDVHTMRREAANSLLKLLEEPPDGNILFLTADESEPLLPTILSRCQVIPFYPLPLELAAAIIKQDNPDLSPEKSTLLASLTNGCPGLAKSIDGETLLLLREEILETLLTPQEDEAEAMESALVLAAKTAAMKDGLDSLLDLLRFFFKETMLFHLRDAPGQEDRPEDDAKIARARELWNLPELSDKVEAIDFAEKALDRNCNQGLVCEVLFMHLMGLDRYSDTQPAARRN